MKGRYDAAPGKRQLFAGQKKNPQPRLGVFGIKTLAMTYSRMRMHTTIGACAFHFRVRNGIGWDHAAIVTRERVEGRGPGIPVAPRSRSVASGRPMGPAFGE